MVFKKDIRINKSVIGTGNPCYIIAEMSANHNKSFEHAIKIVEMAKEIGADAVKLQTYAPDTITIDCRNKWFRIGPDNHWSGRNLYDLYKEAHTPWEWVPKLKEKADEIGIDLFSTPFDFSAVDYLEKMKMPAYKIASFEIVDLPLIEYIAKTGKPIIMSTGMAKISEIEEAVEVVKKAENTQLVLLKCLSAYPSPPNEMNLKTINNLSETFAVPSGLSDHSLGIGAAIAGVVLGASIIEKHFTLSRKIKGPDSEFSLEPDEFKELIRNIRIAEDAIGDVHYGIMGHESANRVFRRSLFVVKDVKTGDPVTPENLRSIRPGYGLHPKYLPEAMGRKFRKDIPKGTPLSWKLI